MTRIPQEPQENPGTVPVLRTPTDVSAIITEQNATMQHLVDEFNRLQNQLVEHHNAMLTRLDTLQSRDTNSAASRHGVASIARVQYVQQAAVLGYPVIRWIDPNDGSTKRKDLGAYQAVGTQQEFNLVDEGIPDGASVKFSSYVAGIGEYEIDPWFTFDSLASQGATFKQTGTAFKGWFQYMGLYRPYILDGNFKANPISRVKYVQNAAVSAYLIAHWTDPNDGTSHSKELGPWKAIATEEEFNLVDEEIPEGSSVHRVPLEIPSACLLIIHLRRFNSHPVWPVLGNIPMVLHSQ
ncbi:hypothetical protein B0H16DRAFT_1582330 [Mycena metata]|uniref:Uncharacterized protein n=1 Tax=Mycena metata TaxID=1033252 RepID=A0AAD7I007_9AGAR|nr:hypothetical protein B0H16DRAFT_1582330 [Mycena metata]